MDDIITALTQSDGLEADGSLEFSEPSTTSQALPIPSPEREPLTTKNAVIFLLEGSLKTKVCRYCLNVVPQLSELDQILQVANKEIFYKVTIRDMIASFHPFKVADDPNLPDKICEKCIDRTISSYLFTQQCEQAERALRNCFDDMYEKLNKLEPLEPVKKRGRQKLNPNYNILYAEHEKVINYADPIIHIVNTASEPLTPQQPINELECLKCCQILPNLESLLNHSKIHPKSMWYNCRLCGTSFPKNLQLKKHFRNAHPSNPAQKPVAKVNKYECKTCGVTSKNYCDHLQHIEKHKFKTVMEHLLDGKMDKLCSVCLNKERNMTSLSSTICVHGASPELTGDRSLYRVLSSTVPEMNILDNYTGTKICEKCLSHAIASYVFINQTYFVRNRLSTCVSAMLENLDKMTETNSNICIEIALNTIMNVLPQFDEADLDESDEKDETKVEVLEDEFRIESESESEIEENKKLSPITLSKNDEVHIKNTVLNGFSLENGICSEFLTFKKKPKPKSPMFTCPICRKRFVSDYFLKRHVLKHVPRKVECNICSLQFKSNFDLYEHKKMNHILSKSIYLSCKICGRCYTKEDKLKNHVKQHKNQLCQLCDKKFRSQYSYNAHIQRHVNKLGTIMKKYTQNCSFCEKNCPNDNEFSLHVNKVHLQLKPYDCDMCERHFYTEHNLKSHRKVHSLRSTEQCHFCNKVLSSRKRLVIHIRKHIGETPFLCQICNKAFYSQFNLRKHVKVYHASCKTC